MSGFDLLYDVAQAYISTVQFAVSLMQQYGFPAPQYAGEWIDYAQGHNRGTLNSDPPIKYFLHGIGCRLDLPSGPIDWDFGYQNRTDGFDAGRLWHFAKNRKEQFPDLPDEKSFEVLFAEAIDNRIVAQPFREKADYLYYWQAQANRRSSGIKTVCPRCEQDYLVKANIRPLEETIWICPECDAIWPVDAQPRFETFADYATYMESKGRRGLWDFLDIQK